jgi:hypothetical protein
MMLATLPAREPLLALLALASAAHLLALLALGRHRLGLARGLAGLAQLLLLIAMAGVGLRALAVNEPSAWLPARSADVLDTAAWLALVIYLVAGAWWRSPGLGISLPVFVLLVLLLAALTRDVLVTNGLGLAVALRPVYGALGGGALALAGVGLAGWLARGLERRALGSSRLAPGVVAILLTVALLLLSGQLALAGYGWTTRPRSASPWTLQQTWLAASWVVLVLTTVTAWRGRRGLIMLAGLVVGLLVLGVTVVAANGTSG